MVLGLRRHDLARDDLALRQGGGAPFLVGAAVDEVTFEIELVADVMFGRPHYT